MSININIQKKDLWLLSAIVVFLVGVGYIIATNSETPKWQIHGHSADEIEGGGAIQSVQVVGTTNIQAGTNWADMNNMTINMNTNGGDVFLMFSGNIEASGNTNVAGTLRFSVDGTNRHQMLTEAGDGAWQNDFSMIWLEKNLPAGSHTFKVQWKGTNSNVQQDGATYPRVFAVMEV